MIERPFIRLDSPSTIARKGTGYRPPALILPTPDRQTQRLEPQFRQLQVAFDTRRAELQASPEGAAPEQVLVLETVGSVESFVKAVRKIPGMEWLAERDEDGIPADDDFHEVEDPNSTLRGRLYLVMTNQAAMTELLRLWQRFTRADSQRWPRGLAKWKDLFRRLRTLRHWDTVDRLDSTGILDAWRESVSLGAENVRVEVELWFRPEQDARAASEASLRRRIEDDGGQVVGRSLIPEITYHAVLAQLPIRSVERILASADTQLVRCDEVMFFRPTGQCAFALDSEPPDADLGASIDVPSATGDPTVALLDGLPLANHVRLTDRLIVDDPSGWSTDYSARDRQHGTAMASLIIHGDITDGAPPLRRPIYVRPILKPGPDWIRSRTEMVPDDVLFVDLLHQAVRRMFDGDGSEPPAAPTVRIVNLSVCDSSRPFDRTMSPVARMLDWLSVHYNVLFIVSAGNHTDSLELEVDRAAFDSLSAAVRQERAVQAIVSTAHRRRILAPAEAVNALTVGAVHSDSAKFPTSGDTIDLVGPSFPSPLNGLGPGYQRSVKPDVFAPGGRQLYQLAPSSTSRPVRLTPIVSRQPPGHAVAAPGLMSAPDTGMRYARGTSNAAALVTRHAAALAERLESLDTAALSPVDLPVLLRAFLAHSASWGSWLGDYIALIRSHVATARLRDHVTRYVGYGAVNAERLDGCTEERATAYTVAHIARDEVHSHRFPLPPGLIAQHVWRRLTVTLSWFSPVEATTRNYRSIRLSFDAPTMALDARAVGADFSAGRRGTLQHQVFEGTQASAFVDGDVATVNVECRIEGGAPQQSIRYALVVSLEVAPGVGIPVYSEVRARIRAPIAVGVATSLA